MSSYASSIADQAIAWHLRRDALTEADWLDFIAWLESDPAHACAYDAVARQDRMLDQARFPVALRAANDDERSTRRAWPWLAGGLAAAALVALTLPLTTQQAPTRVIATPDGVHRNVRLADGTQIAMNGGTTLRLDAAEDRSAVLEHGEVTIHVVHDERRPFTLRAGGEVIRDLGTTFNVLHAGGVLSVAVAGGSVVFQPDGVALRLGAGDAVTLRANSHSLIRSHVQRSMVGSWRGGTLSFESAPLSEVAEALQRGYDFGIALEGDLSRRPFTGIIRFTGHADRDVPHLAGLIGATWRREGGRWILAASARTPA